MSGEPEKKGDQSDVQAAEVPTGTNQRRSVEWELSKIDEAMREMAEKLDRLNHQQGVAYEALVTVHSLLGLKMRP